MSKSYDERRKIKKDSFTFLVDDDDMTAWISEGQSDGGSVMTLPEAVELEGKAFRIKSVEIGGYCNEHRLEELFIPDCYEYIDEDSFRDCENLKTVHIGKGLEWYSKWSFNGSPLERVEVDPANPFMKVSDDGTCMLSKDGKVLMYNFVQKKSIAVQDGVEELSECAFSCNDITEEIILPSSLRKLGPNSIFECHNLKKIVFNEGLEEAGLQSISWDDELEEIDFPVTFRHLGYEAITGDTKLKRLILRSPSVVEIDAGTRFNALETYPTETCRLLVPKNLLEEYLSHPSWEQFKHIEALQ